MRVEEIKRRINNNLSIKIISEENIQNGIRLKFNNGSIINCFNNGNHSIQGKNIEDIKQILEKDNKISDEIFVVYGHDEIAKTQLEALLRRWGLKPIILDQLVSQGRTIIEKLEEYSSRVQYAIVLATPDDEGKDKNEKTYKNRVRQNVSLELGMFLAKLGREKVAILLKEDENFEKPSDIQGLIYIPFKEKIEEVALNLIRELQNQGYNITNF